MVQKKKFCILVSTDPEHSQRWCQSAPLLLPLWFPPDQRPSRPLTRLTRGLPVFLTGLFPLDHKALLVPL